VFTQSWCNYKIKSQKWFFWGKKHLQYQVFFSYLKTLLLLEHLSFTLTLFFVLFKSASIAAWVIDLVLSRRRLKFHFTSFVHFSVRTFWETAYCPRPRAFLVYIIGPNFFYVGLSDIIFIQVKLNFIRWKI